MLDKLLISGVASLIAYKAHPCLRTYLENKDGPAKDLLPGRVTTAVIIGAGTYLGMAAYRAKYEKVGNPLEDRNSRILEILKNPATIATLANVGLSAYNICQTSKNSTTITDNSHKLAELSEILSKWAAEQANVPTTRDKPVETEPKN